MSYSELVTPAVGIRVSSTLQRSSITSETNNRSCMHEKEILGNLSKQNGNVTATAVNTIEFKIL